MAQQKKHNKNIPHFDLDLWEKLFSAIVFTGILLIFGLMVKYSVEEISFSDVVIKTAKLSELMFFHMSTASFGAFFFIIMMLFFKFKTHVSFSILSKSIRSYLIFFVFVNLVTILVDRFFDYGLLSIETYSLSFGAGLLLAVVIHFVGKYV